MVNDWQIERNLLIADREMRGQFVRALGRTTGLHVGVNPKVAEYRTGL